jgi:ribosome biogenesis GTPase A
VAPDAAEALNGIVEELQMTVRQLCAWLTARRADLRARLEQVSSADVALLGTLERRGLDLAVFGCVSSGKSSLLNRLLGRDVLPVGVNPITAVPTRITWGSAQRLRVWLADAGARELDIADLSLYASERENPANHKRVLRLVLFAGT